MRIIGHIEHPSLKISVFKNDGRSFLKLETALYEQTFKLGDDERFSTLEGVQNWVDAPFLEDVMNGFRHMHKTRLDALARRFPADASTMFEEII